MIRIPGQRANSYRYLYGGYAYYQFGETATYLCALRAITALHCPGKVRVGVDGRVEMVTVHSHMPDGLEDERHAMKEEMRRRARETLVPLKEIFDEVSLDPRYSRASQEIAYNAMRTTLNRERSKGRPPIPETLDDLGVLLANHDAMRQFFRGTITTARGKVALIFASDMMIAELNAVKEIHADATFRAVPMRPPTDQFFILHFRRADSGFAAVYVLCEERTTDVYMKIWEKLFELAPNLQANLEIITCDFEQALATSVRQSLPTTRIRGCWFHYTQAVLRMWRRLGVRGAPQEILWMAMSLALVPPERFEEGIQTIGRAADIIAREFPFVDNFVRYLQRQWLPRAEIVSVSDTPVRTNNIAENFHRHIVARLGGVRNNVWKFLEKLKDMIKTNDVNWQRTTNGHRLRRHDGNRQNIEDARIFAAQEKLASGRYTMDDFLRIAVDPHRRNRINDEPEQENDENLIDDPDAIEEHEAIPPPPEAVQQEQIGLEVAQGVPDAAAQHMHLRVDDARPEQQRAEIAEEIVPAVAELAQNPPVEDFVQLAREEQLPLRGDYDAAVDCSVTTCRGCFAAAPEIAFIPCGHLCLCRACYAQMNAIREQDQRDHLMRRGVIDLEEAFNPVATCPFCREPYTGQLRIYY